MSLHVPAIRTNTIKRSGSGSSLRHSSVEHENDLQPVTRSRRNSDSSLTSPRTLETPSPTTTTPHAHSQTTLYAGPAHKPFTVPTDTLQSQSPYFQRLLSETPDPTPEQTTFEDVDEAGMKLFCAWVKEGDDGAAFRIPPRDWHEVGMLLAGYVVAWKFGGEGPRGVGGGEGKEKRKERRKGKAVSLFRLKLSPKQPSSPAYDQTPTVIDLIRTHYHSADLTAPPYRLEYITRYAPGSLMQRFLFSTAAYRCLSSSSSVSNSPANSPSAAPSPDPAISEAMKTMFLKTPNLAVEFIEALIRVHREGCRDARKGLSCPEWHVHERTKVCPRGFVEAWEGE
ncbi:hypothetical protein D0862_00797 [Hortaea werneckii]|uniref:BTB domain-containing protein n=1 Tax=Hortaea werneckii TaxID=91943 RepID=A0A3M7HW24_HORWE|nr:hypothetical protein D0862_00797 [Hortaea werneckii]